MAPDAVLKTAIHEYECNVIGIRDGYDGFLNLDALIITRGMGYRSKMSNPSRRVPERSERSVLCKASG